MGYLKVLAIGSAVGFASWIAYKKKIPKEMEYIEFKKENVKLKEKANIAIIGSGIGGSSAAFFIRNTFGDHVSIDIFEKDSRIGGRIKTVDFAGHQVEGGGGIIHESNRYMISFAKHCELELVKAVDGKGKFGIWDGDKFLFQSMQLPFNLLWRYGIFSLRNLNNEAENFATKFSKIYSKQNVEQKSFRLQTELLEELGGKKFIEYAQKSTKDVMSENGVNQLLIDELVTGVLRYTFGQDANVNALIGYHAMGGSGGSLFSVKGGNQQVCEKLIDHAECEHVNFNTKVVNIHKKTSNDKKTRYVLQTEKGEKSKEYDVIIVASPLEIPSCYFQCSKCEAWPEQNPRKEYQTRFVTLVQGNINAEYFDLRNTKDTLGAVMTVDNEKIPFSAFGLQKTTEGTHIDPPIYKMFSNNIVTEDQLSKLFTLNNVKPAVFKWFTGPKFLTPEDFTPFILDEGVFYVNGIERLGSGMELSAIGGCNVALLAKHYLFT